MVFFWKIIYRFVRNGPKRRKITKVPHLTQPKYITSWLFMQIYPVERAFKLVTPYSVSTGNLS